MIIYNQITFGEELKKKIINKENIIDIANWSSKVQHYNEEDMNEIFDELLDHLSLMSAGEEFEYTYEELEKIADDLIAGKDVRLL